MGDSVDPELVKWAKGEFLELRNEGDSRQGYYNIDTAISKLRSSDPALNRARRQALLEMIRHSGVDTSLWAMNILLEGGGMLDDPAPNYWEDRLLRSFGLRRGGLKRGGGRRRECFVSGA